MIQITKEEIKKFVWNFVKIGEAWLIRVDGQWHLVPKEEMKIEWMFNPKTNKTHELYYYNDKPMDKDAVVSMIYRENNYTIRGTPLSESTGFFLEKFKKIFGSVATLDLCRKITGSKEIEDANNSPDTIH